MTMSFTLKYTGSCPTQLGLHLLPGPPLVISKRDGEALEAAIRQGFVAACHLLSFQVGEMGSQRIPTVGSSVPGVTTWPGSLQTWAHVDGDRQEL